MTPSGSCKMQMILIVLSILLLHVHMCGTTSSRLTLDDEIYRTSQCAIKQLVLFKWEEFDFYLFQLSGEDWFIH